MTIKIIIALVLGVLAGGCGCIDFDNLSFSIIDILTYMILFVTGISLGYSGNIKENIKKSGTIIIFIPPLVVIGGLVGGVVSGILLGEDIIDTVIVSAGNGWYTFSGALLSKYDGILGSVAFLSNLFRELLGVILAPFIAKNIGYLKTIAPGGATSAYTSLPSITRYTDNRTALIAFLNGMILTMTIPVLLQFLLAIKY